MATKSEGAGLIVCAISFQDFQHSDHKSPTLQTDSQTDGRHAIPRPRKCTKVHCAVKISHRHFRTWRCEHMPIHHSSTAAAAQCTGYLYGNVSSTSWRVSRSRLSCTVGLGSGLSCRRLSAGCRFRTEIPRAGGRTPVPPGRGGLALLRGLMLRMEKIFLVFLIFSKYL